MESKFSLSDCLPTLVYGDDVADLKSWSCEESRLGETADEVRRIRTYMAPDGLLALRVTIIEYKDFPAVRYVPELIGCGREPSRTVSDFMSFDLRVEQRPCAETLLRATTGSTCQACDFTSRTFVLSSVTQQDALEFASDEGLSSTNWMPYFGLELSESEGYDFGIGWSGAWRMSVQVTGNALRCAFGMKNFRSYLMPGETLRQPSVLAFRRSGVSVLAFRTVIHDFMVKHNAPRDSKGGLLKPILPITLSGGNRKPEDALKVISFMVDSGLPFDAVWMDAGWNGPEHLPKTTTNCGDVWWKYVGDWRVNTGIHTTGTLKPISDAVHAAGRRFLLWFEPERLMNTAPILQEHPEFARMLPYNPDWKREGVTMYLLDLGNEQAFQWIFATLCKVIDENGVDIYRQDFNIDPWCVWCEHDEAGRAGVNEIRHVTGLYRLWDALRKRYPDMLIDNCCAGGRRLDFELLSRSHSYCRSDYFIPRNNEERHKYQILMGQNALINLLDWVPFQGSEANCIQTFSDYDFFSNACTGLVFTPFDWEGGCITREFTSDEKTWFSRMFRVADRIRNILTGTFYPLTETANLSENVWVGYEGIQDVSGEGVLAFFRRKHAAPSMTFELKGIVPDAQYEIEDASTGERKLLNGSELTSFNVSFANAPDARVLFFRKVSK